MRKLALVGFFILAFGCAPKSSNEENTLAQISDPEVMKFAISGKTLYENYCGNCHQSDGKGLGKLIPPLRDADYFKESVHRSIWIMRHGQNGEITVKGQKYNQAMPANPNLKPLEIAQIATYLYNIWGMNEGVITSSDVEGYLKNKPENY
ncbi:c-type cytochrome [Algoriphagus boritolerans]|uniref:Cytochrome c n=1 Tax=Algoriphagus boritolerans DSM 17298 = JCM 18970 TaxID=1120964 RepID=A0A1H5ZM93_9BACT|nr:cytochrome c [Algoriphagus boritolerans]SEG37539.1 Cytochrome c [Algoriphagus boritolerans DSM 17298 = JCM 18970]